MQEADIPKSILKFKSSRWETVSISQKYQTANERKKFIDSIKINLCLNIRRIAQKDRYTQRELAIIWQTSESRVSKVIRQRHDELTIDILFNYLHMIEPRTKVLVAI